MTTHIHKKPVSSVAQRCIGALALSLLSTAPTSAADSINGQVLGGWAPIVGSTVTLWAEGANAPRQLAQTQTGADGRFTLTAGGQGANLYLIAKGGRPLANAAVGENPGIALLAVLGSKIPPNVIVNEMTTIASVWTHAQFLDDDAIKGNALGLKITAGNVPHFVNLETGGWGETIQDPLNGSQTSTMANFATLADLLSACVTRFKADSCNKLFAAATQPKGAAPTNTLTAAQSIARYPWYQSEKLFALLNEFYPVPAGRTMREVPFMPYLSFPPSAWVLPLKLMAEAIAPAEKRCLIVKATFGSATISRLVGRPRMRCGRVTPASSIRTENLYPQLRPVLPAVGCKEVPLAQPSMQTTTPGLRATEASRSPYSTRTASR